jgi:hypothetical protein
MPPDAVFGPLKLNETTTGRQHNEAHFSVPFGM